MQIFLPFLAVMTTGVLGVLIHPFKIPGYPLLDFGYLAWIYLVPLFLILPSFRPKGVFVLALMAAFILNFGNFYWLVFAMKDYGEVSLVGSIGTFILLGILLSFFFALALALANWVYHRRGFPLFLLNAIFLMGADFFITHFPANGFPWGLPAYSQGRFLDYFQWIDVTGVFGINLLIYLVNGLIADFMAKGSLNHRINRFLILFFLAVASFFGSIHQQNQQEGFGHEAPHRVLALIQGNIPQEIKWDPIRAEAHLETYVRLTEVAATSGADLAIWPEAAYPYNLNLQALIETRIVAREKMPIPVLFGSVSLDPSDSEKGEVIYNSALLMSKDIRIEGVYHKQHLVPFGEYIPFKEWLWFTHRLVDSVDDFSPGNEVSPLGVKGLQLGILICYEDIFPDIARQRVSEGATVLVNMTNDAWYGDTQAQYQHLVFSQFRALENRRYLVRSTNTGITAAIDPRGQVMNTLAPFKEGILLGNVAPRTDKTLYNRYGDYVAWMCVWLLGIVFLLAVTAKRRMTDRRS